MSLELTGVHGLLKRHKLFTHKLIVYRKNCFVLIRQVVNRSYFVVKNIFLGVPFHLTFPHIFICPL